LAGGEPVAGRRWPNWSTPDQLDSLDAWLKARHAGRQSAVRLRLRDGAGTVLECELAGFRCRRAAVCWARWCARPATSCCARPGSRAPGSPRRRWNPSARASSRPTRRGHDRVPEPAAEALLGCHARARPQGRQLAELVSLVDELDRRRSATRSLVAWRRPPRGPGATRAAGLAHLGRGALGRVARFADPRRRPQRAQPAAWSCMHDVSELRGLTRQMSYQASHDPLTGWPTGASSSAAWTRR
jgi:hypothetical protein